MSVKRAVPVLVFLAALVAGGTAYLRRPAEKWQELAVKSERFRTSVAESGTVQPENKISLNAPISGRIDRISVDEGTPVKRGQVLAWMSSTDRAALLDSARSEGPKAVEEMSQVYRATPIVSPMAGVVIARSVVVGQTVTSATTLFDLSDRLIVMADVDETDLGKIRMGQEATVKVDSYPDLPVRAKVLRIAHQSVTKNSINVYHVQLEPEKVPPEFRAGLTATVYFLLQDKENALVLPAWVAEGRENFAASLKVRPGGGGTPEERSVRLGASNGKSVEVLEGLSAGDVVLVREQKVLSEGKNAAPFVRPGRGGGRR